MTEDGADISEPREDSLVWGVKESFLAYVSRMHGRTTLVEPASAGESGFVFPRVPGSAGDMLDFTGGVSFSAHGGALDITLAEPVVVFTGRGGLLGVADPANLLDASRRVVIAELTESADHSTPTHVGYLPSLTLDGSLLFGGVYSEGEHLDAVSVPRSLVAEAVASGAAPSSSSLNRAESTP